ncbi:hypothetical protein H257_07572 [Aphanomyces astaci]|uniref:Apple domain-containing protein n=1 Tax=Aphanomyces astaci TaxID=112090 RepID=W4GGA6_APHAT|nr:hypothetical protein H257_07572 [Aphanomyces astaci]ETV78727.1 hypothetical protein H257_07572 [Aphanomyces astaci]|eukprot:XP_009831446.1 hypothetical protein H257_07572 [Aphanomyces astaci]
MAKVASIAALLVGSAAALTMTVSMSTELSCHPIEGDVDYVSTSLQLQRTSRDDAEACCDDCRRMEAVCDFFTWTDEEGGTCELKQLELPLTKVPRPGAKVSLLIPCRCSTGDKCNSSGVCTGCSLFGACYNYDKAGCTHGGGKMCDGLATTSTTKRPTTTKPASTSTSSTTPDSSPLTHVPSPSAPPESSTVPATSSSTPTIPVLVTGTSHAPVANVPESRWLVLFAAVFALFV